MKKRFCNIWNIIYVFPTRLLESKIRQTSKHKLLHFFLFETINVVLTTLRLVHVYNIIILLHACTFRLILAAVLFVYDCYNARRIHSAYTRPLANLLSLPLSQNLDFRHKHHSLYCLRYDTQMAFSYLAKWLHTSDLGKFCQTLSWLHQSLQPF